MKRPHPRHPLAVSLFVLTLSLLLLGLLAVYNASVVEAYRDFGNKYHFVFQQLKWTGLGLIIFFITSLLPPQFYKKIALPFFLLCLLLMIAVLIPGIGNKVQGARRWIALPGFSLQPSELLKLSLIIYLSAWLETPRKLVNFLAVLALVLGLTMLQPDLGTAIVLATTGFLIYYVSGAPIIQLVGLASTGVLGIIFLILSSPYRRARLTTFLDPTQDPLGASYHINQVLIALGSGGLTGVGLGRSRQKYQYLPEATTDSIFAVIAEELGFIGSLILILLLLGLIILAFKIAAQSTNRFNQLLATGIAGWISVQFLLNLSAMVALVPLTGIPLPLISYGGSSLISTLVAIGVLTSIAKTLKT